MSEPIVSRDPGVMGGEPCIRGTRIGVYHLRHRIQQLLEQGTHPANVSTIVREQYSDFPRLDAAELAALLSYPAWEFDRRHGDDDDPDVQVQSGSDSDEVVITHQSDSMWLPVEHIDLLIAYLTAAQTAYQDHLERVSEWEREQA